jgi:signal transduction histidine kinase
MERMPERRSDQVPEEEHERLLEILHDLRAPLAPILAGAQALRRRGVGGAEVAAIERQVQRMVRLLGELVAEQVGEEPSFGRVMLAEPIAEAADTLRPALESGRHVLAVRGAEHAEVLGDRERLGRAMVNVLDNALKHSGPASRIAIEVVRRGDQVEIEVTDPGEGLVEPDSERLFDAFVQGVSAARAPGLGLGLHIVRSIAEFHGGSVRVFSAGRGQGARFTIGLPAAEVPGERRMILVGDLRRTGKELRELGFAPCVVPSPRWAAALAATLPVACLAVERRFLVRVLQALAQVAPSARIVPVTEDITARALLEQLRGH